MFALLINAAILIVASATFYRSGHHDVVEIRDAYKLLSPLLNRSGEYAVRDRSACLAIVDLSLVPKDRWIELAAKPASEVDYTRAQPDQADKLGVYLDIWERLLRYRQDEERPTRQGAMTNEPLSLPWCIARASGL
jgi:natural resistance-associated macrophage protein